MTNEELCLRYRSGDSDAADELLQQNKDLICRIAAGYDRRYTGLYLDTNDYVQEGTMALLRAAEHFDFARGIPFLPYVRRAICNAIMDAIRAAYPYTKEQQTVDCLYFVGFSNEKKQTRIRELLSSYESSPEWIYLRKEELEELYAAMDTLSYRERTWIDWRYGFADGESHSLAEMAREYNMTESWAKSTERKALQKLRRKMKIPQN